MSFTEDVIDRTKHLESLLTSLGGIGRGLHERISSIESLLDEALLRRLRFIASVRNKLMHEHGYTFDDDPRRFIASCDAAIADLSALLRERPLLPKAEPFTRKAPKKPGPVARPGRPRSKSTASRISWAGCLPASTCIATCLLVLPFSCTRLSQQSWWPFAGAERAPDWELIIFWTFILATITFLISRTVSRR